MADAKPCGHHPDLICGCGTLGDRDGGTEEALALIARLDQPQPGGVPVSGVDEGLDAAVQRVLNELCVKEDERSPWTELAEDLARAARADYRTASVDLGHAAAMQRAIDEWNRRVNEGVEAPPEVHAEAVARAAREDVPAHVTPAQIEGQRAKGWPDFHPEDYCHLCGRPNPVWFAGREDWLAATSAWAAETGREGICCPSCFAAMHAEQTGKRTTWHLTSEDVPALTQQARADALEDFAHNHVKNQTAGRIHEDLLERAAAIREGREP